MERENRILTRSALRHNRKIAKRNFKTENQRIEKIVNKKDQKRNEMKFKIQRTNYGRQINQARGQNH
jgi:hypothetical protein